MIWITIIQEENLKASERSELKEKTAKPKITKESRQNDRKKNKEEGEASKNY